MSADPPGRIRGIPRSMDPEHRDNHAYHISSVAGVLRHGVQVWNCAVDTQMVRALVLAEMARRERGRVQRVR